jgi:putative flippase GtrA
MSREAPGQWFATAMAAIARHLPFGLSDVIPPNIVGYLIINGCTFGIDLGLLTVFYGSLGLPLALATTMSYAIASLISYTCNRILNFQSHGAVGTQLPLYIGVLTVNYLAFILGVQEGLHHLGLEYQVGRILAACCEGVFLYSCMRWLVFRDAMGSTPVGPEHEAQAVEAEASTSPAGGAEGSIAGPGTAGPEGETARSEGAETARAEADGVAGPGASEPGPEPEAGSPRQAVPARPEAS